MKKRRNLLIFLLILSCTLATGLAWRSLTDKGEQVRYLTEAVRVGQIRKTVEATGQIGAVQLVNVGAQASGQILKLHVTLGQQVRKGDLIAEIDSTTQLNELNTSKARLETYRAQLAARQVALKTAKTKYEREKLLKKSDSTSRESMEDAENTYAAAQASVAELKSQILQTQIAVNTAETNAGYTRIAAPLDGTVVSVPVEEGQTVNANQTTPTIVQIADLARMKIKIEIAEGDITKVRPGMEVQYSILSDPDKTYTATLDSLDPGLTTLSDGTYGKATNDATSAIYYYANAVVPNPDGRLRIGMTTQNTILVADVRDVLIIPGIAVDGGIGASFVRVLLPDGTVEERPIKTGESDTMNIEIVSGLAVGDQVISSQLSRSEADAVKYKMRGPL